MATGRNLRHGNYDYATASITWDPGISEHTMPSSLYLTAKPAFFGTYTWPWVQPEGATKVYSLPARNAVVALGVEREARVLLGGEAVVLGDGGVGGVVQRAVQRRHALAPELEQLLHDLV